MKPRRGNETRFESDITFHSGVQTRFLQRFVEEPFGARLFN
jgi:hypothetical protein